jgi:hypothetical protein
MLASHGFVRASYLYDVRSRTSLRYSEFYEAFASPTGATDDEVRSAIEAAEREW